MSLHELDKDLSDKKMNSFSDYFKFWIHFSKVYFKTNILFFISIFFILYFLKGDSMFQKYITFGICGLSAYLGHVLAHKSGLWNFLSGHVEHHDEKKTFFRDLREFGSDIFASGFLLLVMNLVFKRVFSFSLLNNYVIVLFMIGFPSVHLINYHFFLPKSFHSIHHENTQTNFSPDIYDHLFNTNYDNRIENMSHMIPNFTVIAIIVIILQKIYSP